VDVIAAVVLLGRMVTGYRGAQRPLDVYLGYGGGIVIVVRMRIGWLGFVVVVTMMIGMMIHSSVCGVSLFVPLSSLSIRCVVFFPIGYQSGCAYRYNKLSTISHHLFPSLYYLC
jgi:hypothetical protein